MADIRAIILAKEWVETFPRLTGNTEWRKTHPDLVDKFERLPQSVRKEALVLIIYLRRKAARKANGTPT